MGISINVLSQVTIMFLLIAVGFFCYKKVMVNEETAAQMSEILLFVVTPAVIIRAFQIDFKPQLAKGLVLSLALAIVSQLFGVIVSTLFIKTKNNKNYTVERFACVYGNSGFMGIPLIASVLPGNGVFYASAFIAVFNIFMWTHGITIMSGQFSAKDLLKVLKSPPIIGIFIGLFLFFFSIRLPVVVGSAVGFVADLNTPLAMIIIGIYVAKSNILNAFKNARIYLISFLRLIIVPMIMIIIFMFFRVNDITKTIIIANVIASACPTAASTLLIATKYKAGPEYASKIITATTLFSIITIPLIMFMLEKTMGIFAL